MACGRGAKHLLYDQYRTFLGNWPDILRVRVVVAKPGVRYKRDGAHAWRPFDQELARILVSAPIIFLFFGNGIIVILAKRRNLLSATLSRAGISSTSICRIFFQIIQYDTETERFYTQ